MSIEEIRKIALTIKGVEESFPFDDQTLVFKVMGRMFLCVCLEKPDLFVVKSDPEIAAELKDRYEGIEGAFHFNKKYWIQVWLNRDVDDSLIHKLVENSLQEVLKKLTKRDRLIYAALT